jgi:hypothetical protein
MLRIRQKQALDWLRINNTRNRSWFLQHSAMVQSFRLSFMIQATVMIKFIIVMCFDKLYDLGRDIIMKMKIIGVSSRLDFKALNF